ncbi:MAG: peptide deformylase, partial [Bacteroidota bacterium]
MKYLALLSTVIILSACTALRGTQNSSFSSKEAVMISEKGPAAPMRVYKINNHEDSILLRKSSQAIKPNLK